LIDKAAYVPELAEACRAEARNVALADHEDRYLELAEAFLRRAQSHEQDGLSGWSRNAARQAGWDRGGRLKR
jgi:hypothetical protein